MARVVASQPGIGCELANGQLQADLVRVVAAGVVADENRVD
jgi:hypothetical protein